MADNIIEFNSITKTFPGVTALNDVSFGIERGEVLALCGENGAGKSTLINLCGGYFHMDSGYISYNGERVAIGSTKKSENLGISIVYQEIPVCTNLTIAENMFISSNPLSKFGVLDRRTMREKTREILEVFKINRDPDELIGDITLAEQSFVQIAKAIYQEPELLILDEPTSSLSEEQKDILFETLEKIRKERTISILYVSHRMAEIFQISNRIAVLKDGAYMGTVNTEDVDYDDVIELMVGRQIESYDFEGREIGDTVLEVKNLNSGNMLHDINFSIKSGEILGFGGFQGAGRTEIANAIMGLDKKAVKEIFISGRKARIKHPKHAIKFGVSLISEDRKKEGILPIMSVKENLIMAVQNMVASFGFFNNKKIDVLLREYIEMLNIKCSNVDQSINKLSGGNQQKVIIARWLARNPKVLICDEPTRGIDVGAKAEIHKILDKLAREGMAIIMISSELPELIGVSDRVIVMHEGRITGRLEKSELTEQKIMRLAASIEQDC